MWWPAGAHVIFCMHFEKADGRSASKNVAEMRRLEANAGARWKI
jgi:hypothetical protein